MPLPAIARCFVMSGDSQMSILAGTALILTVWAWFVIFVEPDLIGRRNKRANSNRHLKD
jgi:hypothetical protein